MKTAPHRLYLPKWLADVMLNNARALPEEEVCGLIARTKNGKYNHYPITNVAKKRSCRYAMAPKELINTLRKQREHNETLFAIYHSHPYCAPLPSGIDIQEATYPDAYYIIVSPTYHPSIRAFRIHEHTAQECLLTIENDTSI